MTARDKYKLAGLLNASIFLLAFVALPFAAVAGGVYLALALVLTPILASFAFVIYIRTLKCPNCAAPFRLWRTGTLGSRMWPRRACYACKTDMDAIERNQIQSALG